MMAHTFRSTQEGFRYILLPMPHVKSVALAAYVGVGARHETNQQAGVAHFIEHMLFKGSKRRPDAEAISLAIESLGGHHNALTDRELTLYYVKVPQDGLAEAVDVLADMISAPCLEQSEFEKERNVILDELSMVEDTPTDLCSMLNDELLFPHHALGRSVAGTRETVTALTHGELTSFYSAHYRAKNVIFCAAGAFDEHALERELCRQFSSLNAQPLASAAPDTPKPFGARSTSERFGFREKSTEQAQVCVGFRAFGLNDSRRYALDVLNTILGDGMSCRLFVELREKQALAYDVGSFVSEYCDAGAITMYIGCDPADTKAATSAIFAQLDRLARDVSADELQKAKRMARGRLVLRLEDTQNVAGWAGAQQLLLGKIRPIDDVLADYDRVTLDDLRQLAGELFIREAATVAVVGPKAAAKGLQALLG